MTLIPFGVIEIQQHDPENVFAWFPYHDPSYGWDLQIEVTLLLREAWKQSATSEPNIFQRLFGLPGSTGNLEEVGIRGLPEDIGSTSRMIYEYCGSTAQGATWLFWSELKDRIPAGVGKNWRIIFDTMNAFAKWCEGDKVRLIIWWADAGATDNAWFDGECRKG